MSKSCPRCGKVLSDEARFCGDCGLVIAPSDLTPAPQPEPVTNVPYADDHRPNPEIAVPDQYKPDLEPKNKFLGLGIGVVVAIVVLILAIIIGVIIFLVNMIPKWTGDDLSRQTGVIIAGVKAFLP